MSPEATTGRQTANGDAGMEFAINKTRGLAFSRRDEAGEWQAIDPKSVSAGDLQRVSHAKIGANWFSVYRSGSKK